MADPITGMEVLSDAVKIGLGGSIAWLAAWTTAKQTHKTELAKLREEHSNSIGKMEFERRTRMLTECAESCECVCAAVMEYSSSIQSYMACKRIGVMDIPTEAIQKRMAAIAEALNTYSHALGKLAILGEESCYAALLNVGKGIGGFTLAYNVTSTDEQMANITSDLKAVRQARLDFYLEIQKAFKRHS